MITGVLIAPNLERRVVFCAADAAVELLGGTFQAEFPGVFDDTGLVLPVLHNPNAHAEQAQPNPLASLARRAAATGDSAFFADPIRAVSGPIIVLAGPVADIERVEAAVEDGVRAVEAALADHPEEFQLWQAAALNRRNEA